MLWRHAITEGQLPDIEVTIDCAVTQDTSLDSADKNTVQRLELGTGKSGTTKFVEYGKNVSGHPQTLASSSASFKNRLGRQIIYAIVAENRNPSTDEHPYGRYI